MERSKSLEVGFRQSLSVISTLSSPDSYKHEHATQQLATIDNVKQAASDLITSVSPSSKSLFLAAQLYYDLCERLIAKGLMIEGGGNVLGKESASIGITMPLDRQG